jgi:hypothetical protein
MDTIMLRRLFSLGWTVYKSLDAALANTSPEMLEQTMQQYAAFHGLSSVADVEEHINEPRICSLPDTMPLGTNVCKWPDVNITWDIVADIKGLSRGQVQEGITEALNRWSKVCGIKPVFTPGNPNARILVGSRGIDGPMGVLAESELPCGGVRQCRQWYDNGEPWAMFNGPGNANQIDFIRVSMHELGHALGMNHIGAGNLLAPTYSQSIWTAQSGDIAEMVARYGQPTPVTPPPANSDDLVIRVSGGKVSIDGYRLTKLLTME